MIMFLDPIFQNSGFQILYLQVFRFQLRNLQMLHTVKVLDVISQVVFFWILDYSYYKNSVQILPIKLVDLTTWRFRLLLFTIFILDFRWLALSPFFQMLNLVCACAIFQNSTNSQTNKHASIQGHDDTHEDTRSDKHTYP